jgi:nucleoside-diphosphate-sugar epimerase
MMPPAVDQTERPPLAPHTVIRTQVVVVGSGAGGAVTAATLAARGFEVLLLEEGPNVDTAAVASNSPQAISLLYRNGGLTPIFGNQTIAYVEGRCVGGSTEINSAFWHRLPPDCYHRWSTDFLLEEFTPEVMERYFGRVEAEVSPTRLDARQIPKSSQLFRKGIEAQRWDYVEVPRCQTSDTNDNPFAPGAKQSMQRTYIPRAMRAGAVLLANCKALHVIHAEGLAQGVRATVTRNGQRTPVEIRADAVFLCGGAIQTPAVLRRSRITKNVGDRLCIHPMIKAAALFEEDIEAHQAALPVYQVKEFWPTITLGGSVFTPGFLAMLLADNWPLTRQAMPQWRRMAIYYAASRGMNRGTIRALPGLHDGVVVRYRLSEADQQNLSVGLARLGEILFAAGAKAVYPSLTSHSILRSVDECRGFLKNPIPISAMALSTVHAFSSCPMGENPDRCATNSFGRVHGFTNLYVNDASLIPDSPGVNPQGTTMAIALRNAEHFAEEGRRTAARHVHVVNDTAAARPTVLITGAPGWLGTRLVEVLRHGLAGVERFAQPDGAQIIRCLVQRGADASVLRALGDSLELLPGDLTDPESLRTFCADAENAVLFHIAGIVHPAKRTRDFERVNVDGTRQLLRMAQAAGVRRIVAVSSNSPIGCNPHPNHVFDETAPYNPYMGYGRSKVRMEQLVHEAQAGGQLETVVIRPPWFYGPHQPPRQTLFFTMIKDGRFPILGNGTQRRSMAYVDNICQGLLLAAGTPQANGQTYWIADARPYTILEIVDTVEAVLEEEFGIRCTHRRMRLPALAGDLAARGDALLQHLGWYQQKLHVLGEMHQTIACSIAKAQAELGYAPTYALRDGMIASIRWCLANGHYI